jgi:hypothetical protein
MALAARTWSIQPWIEIPVPERAGRVFTDEAGTVPYIKDILDIATSAKQPEDIIVFTNADTCVRTDAVYLIVGAMQATAAIYSFRRDFGPLNTPLPDNMIQNGTDYVGCDLFAFRVAWWLTYADSFPDLLLGRETWDCVMRLIMNWTNSDASAALPNMIYHERHATIWENHKNRHRLPSQIHNLNLAKRWMAFYKVDHCAFGIR